MEFSQDEVRRGLADAKVAQAEAMPRWREAMTRVFDPAARHSTEAKRQVLGLPDRRAFLRVGGMTIAMSAPPRGLARVAFGVRWLAGRLSSLGDLEASEWREVFHLEAQLAVPTAPPSTAAA